MAGVNGMRITLEATSAVVAHRIIKAGAGVNEGVYATDATEPLLGVTRIGSLVEQGISLQLDAIFNVECAEAIAIGDLVTAGADGRAVVAAEGAGGYILGKALDSTTAAGETLPVIELRLSQSPLLKLTANGAVAAGRLVRPGAADGECRTAIANSHVLGVALNGAADGEDVYIQQVGEATLVADAGVAIGALLSAAAAGRAATRTGTNPIAAVALIAANARDDAIRVQLRLG